jgi:uncharacterized membrane protein YebE (DUF533 family)
MSVSQGTAEAGAVLQTVEAKEAGPPEYDDSVVDVLAAKVLIDWLRNRQQLLIPFTLDLQKLNAPDVEMLVHAMVTAAQADGTVDGKERERVESALTYLNASDEQRATLGSVMDKPQALPLVLADVRDVKTGALVYAASLLAIDQRKRVNRRYLRYLAARLQLSEGLIRSLEQRFRSAA